MKSTFSVVLFLLATNVFSQVKDRRAPLEFHGRIGELSVSPKGGIWLVTAMGEKFYTESIDSNWHLGAGSPKSLKELDLDRPNLERVSFFNKDTAILTGYISSFGNSRKNGLFITQNGGKNWDLIDFGDDSWIYDAFIGKSGRAWIGGSSGNINFSNDFGQHWRKLNSPFNDFSRMHSIFMVDELRGVAGALHNEIYSTTDNWHSFEKIPTPNDQNKYVKEENSETDRIEKIVIWGSYYVVDQKGHIFYSATDKIDWNPFPIEIIGFGLDENSNELYVVDDSLSVVLFSSPYDYQKIPIGSLPSPPLDLKVVDHSLYALINPHLILKVNKNGFRKIIPYTTDLGIEEPEVVRKGLKIKWGFNDNEIYLSDDEGWYRENTLDFYISDAKLVNDSTVILWNGWHNYEYSLREHLSKIYTPENPLNDFLKTPIKSFTINAGSQGCFHYFYDEAMYKSTKNSTFTLKNYKRKNYDLDVKKPMKFEKNVSANSLKEILYEIDTHPSRMPSLADFQITSTDIENYLNDIKDLSKKNDHDFDNDGIKKDRKLYDSLPAMLDTLDDGVIKQVLGLNEGIWSTTTNWFDIKFINAESDTLKFSVSFYLTPHAWHLPWEVEYKGLHFQCFDVAFSKFINECTPEDFHDKEIFDNKYLIMEIANYLWRRKQQTSSNRN